MPQLPFAFQYSIAKNRLLSLKDSVNGYLDSKSALNIPEFEYFLRIYPNGQNEERRRRTMIFLCLEFKNVKKVETDFTFTIESANYSDRLHFVYEESYGWGIVICSTEELFDPEKKFLVDGKFTVKVNGIFKYEIEDTIPAAIKEQKWIGGELGDELWNNNETKNFSIVTADGKEIKVDKFILRSRSEFFKEMLNTCATDSSVEITDFPFNIVETALKIIYNCNFTSKLSMDESMLLFQFFDKYLFSTFKAKVEPLLIAEISASTIVRLTNCSILTNSIKLKEKCMKFLMAAFNSKTALADIEILDKNICMKILQNSLYQIL